MLNFRRLASNLALRCFRSPNLLDHEVHFVGCTAPKWTVIGFAVSLLVAIHYS